MRTTSQTLREALNAQETGEVLVVLLSISHPSLEDPFRISRDPTTRLSEEPLEYGTVSRGETYRFLPFSISLPDDVGERAPVAQIQIENVTRSLVALVRSTTTPATVTIELVLASSPDVVEMELPEMELQGVTYDAGVMTLELAIDALTNEPFPSGSFSPSFFPGLF